MPSLRKLAQIAGVNPSTVTRALRGDSRISVETRRRIEELAAEYHYLPNRLAQSVMTGTSQTIGVLLPSIVTPYSARLLAGVLKTVTAAGYRLIIRESSYQIQNSLAAIQMFIEQRVDGILLDCGHLEPIPRKVVLEMRSQRIIPVGLDSTRLDAEIDHVHTDEQGMATLAVDYLVHLGHQRIAFVGQVSQGHLVGRGRFIRQAMQQRLLSTRYFIDPKDTPPYTKLLSRGLLAQLLKMDAPPTAIIAWEDPIAALLIKEAAQLGVNVPGDISILGFGNLPVADLISPTLTTFEQHPEVVGEQAVRILLERLQQPTNEEVAPPCSLAIRPTLIQRESCK